MDCSTRRSQRSVLVNMRRFPNAKKQYDGHTVAAGVEIASSNGTFKTCYLTHAYMLILFNSILRAFLIEEAKIVKKVIKSQEKAAPRK